MDFQYIQLSYVFLYRYIYIYMVPPPRKTPRKPMRSLPRISTSPQTITQSLPRSSSSPQAITKSLPRSSSSPQSQVWQVEILKSDKWRFLKSDKWRTFSFSSLANPSDPRSKIQDFPGVLSRNLGSRWLAGSKIFQEEFSSKDLHITSNNYKISSKELLITSISSLTSGNSQVWQVEILKSDKWRTFSFSSLANPSDPRSKIQDFPGVLARNLGSRWLAGSKIFQEESLEILDLGSRWLAGSGVFGNLGSWIQMAGWIQDFPRRVSGNPGSWILDPDGWLDPRFS